MASCRPARRKQKWCTTRPLTPLMEGPDLEMHHHHHRQSGNKKEISSSWEVIREWFKAQRSLAADPAGGGGGSRSNSFSMSSGYPAGPGSAPPNINTAKSQDLRLLLGVLACPLGPIPLPINNDNDNGNSYDHHNTDPILRPYNSTIIKDIPIETSTANYIIQQYLAATGCSSKSKQQQQKVPKNMYTAGTVKMICFPTEISAGAGGGSAKTLGTRSSGEKGCFVVWQMSPGMWSLELVVGGNKVLAGSDSKIVWRHSPWLGTHAAKGPQRPLRRIIQVRPSVRLYLASTLSHIYWSLVSTAPVLPRSLFHRYTNLYSYCLLSINLSSHFSPVSHAYGFRNFPQGGSSHIV